MKLSIIILQLLQGRCSNHSKYSQLDINTENLKSDQIENLKVIVNNKLSENEQIEQTNLFELSKIQSYFEVLVLKFKHSTYKNVKTAKQSSYSQLMKVEEEQKKFRSLNTTPIKSLSYKNNEENKFQNGVLKSKYLDF